MTSFKDDLKETVILVYGKCKAQIKQVHKGLLGLLIAFLNLNIILFIIFCIANSIKKQENKKTVVDLIFESMDTKPSIVVAFIVLPIFLIVILQATISYTTKFNQTVLSSNERVNLDNRAYCSMSMLCNFLFLVTRILIYFIILVYAITIVQTILEMHILIDRGPGKLERLVEFLGTFFWTLGMEKNFVDDASGLAQVSTGAINEKMLSINNIFNPLNFFRQMSPNFISNWKGHSIVLLNGSILSVILGLFGVDYKRECSDTDETYEKRIKTQMTIWLVVLSLVLCISYVIIIVYNIIQR